jgi:tetratricopeptide (TPR) repeat protein/predicted Ser/Thr protein kinase
MRSTPANQGPADCLPSGQWQVLEGIVERFEQAWQRGQRPAIADFLPADQALRGAVLTELVLTDLECRLKAGQAAQVEEYIKQFPALQANRDYVVRLIAKEFELRRRRESNLKPADYLQRFPTFRDVLLARLVLLTKGSLDQVSHGRAPAGPPPIAIAGYEILEELGRGGMGVVYKAKQLGLQRLVALKTIAGEQLEGKEHRDRLIAEARAVGRLHHPNIVQVHEVGEQAGRPYFSLEYVDGGNLAQRSKGQPQPSRQAVALIETLARAMDYAHRQGIVHRDLKPANVMLTAQGMPKITDFGLAKRLQEDGNTKTGAVLGTPCYIAPEQATGNKDVGPAADIYALGAILYELLTGRPPFRGDTAMATLLQVIQGNLVSPAQYNARLPRDLETICLKCLERDPGRRYPSAAALADDLHHFLAGECIRARPVSRGVRLLRWCRRRPLAAGLLAATLLLAGACLAGAVLVAVKDRQALVAEKKAQEAELQRQADLLKAAERAQQRLRAFEPYAEATDLLMRAQAPEILGAKDLEASRQLCARAAELLEKANQLDPEFPEAQFALGEAHRLAGLPGRAAEAYLRANDLNQQITAHPHVQALLAAGMAYDAAGDHRNADRIFGLAEQAPDQPPLALVAKAFRLLYANRPSVARPLAEEALRRAPHLWETHFACGFVLYQLINAGYLPVKSNRDQAFRHLQDAVKLSPRQTIAWVSAASYATTWQQRMDWFDKVIALEPKNGDHYVSRGLSHLQFGRSAAAAADFQKGRELGASRTLLLDADASAAKSRGDAEAAFRLYGQLAQEMPERRWYVAEWLGLGFQLRRDTEVRSRFEEWSRSNPEYAGLYKLKAQIKVRDGDWAGAVAEDRAGLKLVPYNHDLHWQLVDHLTRLRHWQEALAATDALLELFPDHFAGHTARIHCLVELGRGGEAKTRLDSLEKDFPDRTAAIDKLRRALAGRLPG